MHLRALLAASFLGLGFAFLHPMPQRRPTATRMSVSGPEPVDRRSWGLTAASALSLLLLPKKSLAEDVTLPSGLSYSVISSGSGPQPAVGELVAIRFTGAYNGKVFDDVYKTPEPLYFRVGTNSLLKGIDEVVLLMKVGDRWNVNIPGDLAFGSKGRAASAGKPRIPPGATVVYDISLVAVPGREEEVITDLDDFGSDEI